jgi:TusA-related sulfurtransferase
MTVSDPEATAREELDVPADAGTVRLDVRDLGPPGPLKETLETLAETDDGIVLVQVNDPAPQHLYPKLDDRGYEYGTVETNDAVVAAVWRP